MLGELPLFGSNATPGVRRPVFEVRPDEPGGAGGALGELAAAAATLLGRGTDDAWQRAVSGIVVDVGLAPELDSADVLLAPAGDAPAVAPGDRLAVALGYADEGPLAVYAGEIESLHHTAGGPTMLRLANASATLASFRLAQSFEDQTAGQVASELARRAGVPTGSVEPGCDLAFLVLDDGATAWQHIARLARVSGLSARVSAADELELTAAADAEPVQRFTWGVDVLGLERAADPPSYDAVTIWGEGAAGSEGKQAWNWLTKQASPVTGTAGSGSRPRSFADRALRSGDALRSAARALAGAAARAAGPGKLLTVGAPAVAPGCRIGLQGTPGAAHDGEYLVRRVRHSYDKRGGFRTRITFESTGGGGQP